MINQTDPQEKKSYIFNFGKPEFSSKNVNNQDDLDAENLEKQLERDAKRKAHNRTQSLADIKQMVIENIYKYLLPFLLLLFVAWAVCCCINALEVKEGIEKLISIICTLFVGALIGKFI